MDNGQVRGINYESVQSFGVLILVVVEDGLVHFINEADSELGDES